MHEEDKEEQEEELNGRALKLSLSSGRYPTWTVLHGPYMSPGFHLGFFV